MLCLCFLETQPLSTAHMSVTMWTSRGTLETLVQNVSRIGQCALVKDRKLWSRVSHSQATALALSNSVTFGHMV